LNWKPNGLHIPYYTAKERGYYEYEGLNLKNIESGKGSDFSAKQAGLGNTEFAITSSDQVVNINSRNLSPKSVGVVMQKSPVVLFTVRENFDEKLTRVSQLEGAKVGTGPGMVRILTKLILEKQGLLNSVEIVDTGYDTVQQLLAGKIDAAGGVFADAVDAEHQDYTADTIRVAHSLPSHGHVIAVKSGFAADHSETVRAFLRATARGIAWADKNPEQATDYLIAANPSLEASRANERDKWKRMSSGFMKSDAVRESGWGWNQATAWATTKEALASADLLGGPVNVDNVWTNKYLDTDYEYIGSFTDKTE
jgi:NitT/TauT family transport system substrate-binding protein